MQADMAKVVMVTAIQSSLSSPTAKALPTPASAQLPVRVQLIRIPKHRSASS